VSNGVSSLREIHIINRYDYVSRCLGYLDWALLHPMFREFLKSRALKYPENLRRSEDFAFALSVLLERGKIRLHS
jgi:hypothetical protein